MYLTKLTEDKRKVVSIRKEVKGILGGLEGRSILGERFSGWSISGKEVI